MPIEGVLGELIPVYHALGLLGIPPSEVDRMEIWQAGAILAWQAPRPGGTSYAQGGLDPYVLARAKAGEAPQIGHMVVPEKGLRFGTPVEFTPRGEVEG